MQSVDVEERSSTVKAERKAGDRLQEGTGKGQGTPWTKSARARVLLESNQAGQPAQGTAPGRDSGLHPHVVQSLFLGESCPPHSCLLCVGRSSGEQCGHARSLRSGW